LLIFGHHDQKGCLLIKGKISNLFKYELSIKTMSIVEKEFGLILVRILMMLLILKENTVLSS